MLTLEKLPAIYGIHDVHTNSVSPRPHYSVLLSNANLTLARGRRYGLVRRNGEGINFGEDCTKCIVNMAPACARL